MHVCFQDVIQAVADLSNSEEKWYCGQGSVELVRDFLVYMHPFAQSSNRVELLTGDFCLNIFWVPRIVALWAKGSPS